MNEPYGRNSAALVCHPPLFPTLPQRGPLLLTRGRSLTPPFFCVTKRNGLRIGGECGHEGVSLGHPFFTDPWGPSWGSQLDQSPGPEVGAIGVED